MSIVSIQRTVTCLLGVMSASLAKREGCKKVTPTVSSEWVVQFEFQSLYKGAIVFFRALVVLKNRRSATNTPAYFAVPLALISSYFDRIFF